jgi:hypothetical protein
MIRSVATGSWEPDAWREHGLALLTKHFGQDCVVCFPDDDPEYDGLDAVITSGIGYLCYAPPGEPLSAQRRATLLRHAIGAGLECLHLNSARLGPLAGSVKLHAWVLLTPKHKAADVVVHCNKKAAEVLAWELPFVADSEFQVRVHDLTMFGAEHAAVTQAMVASINVADLPQARPGADFRNLTGEYIAKMDAKLAKIPFLTDVSARIDHRAALLEAGLKGDTLLDHIRNRAPELGSAFESKIEAALLDMRQSAFASDTPAAFYSEVRKNLVARFIRETTQENAEYLASKCIADWLQLCPLDFEAAS